MDASELRRRRAALGYSQAQLAQRLGVPRMAVYRWERTRPGAVIERPGMLELALQTLERERAEVMADDDDDDD